MLVYVEMWIKNVIRGFLLIVDGIVTIGSFGSFVCNFTEHFGFND